LATIHEAQTLQVVVDFPHDQMASSHQLQLFASNPVHIPTVILTTTAALLLAEEAIPSPSIGNTLWRI